MSKLLRAVLGHSSHGRCLLLLGMLFTGCTLSEGTTDGTMTDVLAGAATRIAQEFVSALAPIVAQMFEAGFLSLIL